MELKYVSDSSIIKNNCNPNGLKNTTIKEEKDIHKEGFKAEWTEFRKATSLHGVRFTTEKLRIRQITWLLIVIAAFAVFTYFVIDRTKYYLEYKMTISVEETYVPEMDFPKVTFCNQNAIRLTAAAENGWYDAVEELYRDADSKDLRACFEENEFTCETNKRCIPLSRKCDSFPDCQDASDERDCELPEICPAVLINGELKNAMFHLQFKSQTYARQHEGTYQYFYFSSLFGQWVISYDDVDHLTTASERINLGGDQGMVPTHSDLYNISCKALDMQSLIEYQDPEHPTNNFLLSANRAADIEATKMLNMEDLFEKGKHERDTFIRSCTWKGKACPPHFIQPIMTDMGMCYTFNTKEKVYGSGPGTGLVMFFNIEQYEYMKDPLKGAGLKMLIHDEESVSVIEKSGVSVSPGLFSLLSMERTQITNLEPPWGNCSKMASDGSSELSRHSCRRLCDLNFTKHECDCRNAGIPDVSTTGGEEEPSKVCTLDQYQKCLPKIIQRGSDDCRCNMSCNEAVYAPSLSFAAVSVDEDNIKSRRQESKMADLTRDLIKAREITFRLNDERYRETMRVLNMINFRGYDMTMFLAKTKREFEQKEMTLIDDSTKICNKKLKQARRFQSRIQSSLQTTLQSFLGNLQILEYQIDEFAFIQNLSESATKMLELELTDYSPLTTIDAPSKILFAPFKLKNQTLRLNASQLSFNLSVDQIMLRTSFHKVLNSLDLTLDTLNNEVDGTLEEFLSEMPIGRNDAKDDHIRDYVADTVLNLTSIRDELIEIFKEKIKNKISGKAKREIENEDAEPTLTTAMTDVIKSTSTMISEFVGNLTERSKVKTDNLTTKCEYEPTNLETSFREAHKQSSDRLGDMQRRVVDFIKKLNDDTQAYIVGNITLNSLAEKFDLSRDRVLFNSFALAVENLITQEIVVITRMVDHSLELEQLLIKQDAKSKAKHEEIRIQMQDFRDSGNSVAAGHHETIKQMRKRVERFAVALHEAERYLETYAEGNRLNENFFRKNYLHIEIFYKLLTEKKLTQNQAFLFSALVSDIGGYLGLYLGGTVLTLFEILDFLVFIGLFQYVLKWFPKKQHENATSAPTALDAVIQVEMEKVSNTKDEDGSIKDVHGKTRWRGAMDDVLLKYIDEDGSIDGEGRVMVNGLCQGDGEEKDGEDGKIGIGDDHCKGDGDVKYREDGKIGNVADHCKGDVDEKYGEDGKIEQLGGAENGKSWLYGKLGENGNIGEEGKAGKGDQMDEEAVNEKREMGEEGKMDEEGQIDINGKLGVDGTVDEGDKEGYPLTKTGPRVHSKIDYFDGTIPELTDLL